MINSLYVHIPFCNSICDYCDFTKLQYFHNFADQYLISLKRDLEINVKNNDLTTIYVGGGTPTSLDEKQLETLLIMLSPFTKKVKEYTFEVNPETVNLEKINLLKKYGVNRISIGVESTDDKVLLYINRKHTYAQVRDCVSLLRENGFNNINVDLIIGLPNVSKKMFENDLKNVLSLSVDHISTYSLTVHPNTVFGINGINEPSDEFSREMYDLAHKILLEHGFIHYEVSNFSKPGKESLHNMTYWKNEEYYAVGLGASGYVGNVRFKNTQSLTKYLQQNFEKEVETVTKKDDEEYQIMLNLRTNLGIDLTEFKNKFNKDLILEKKQIIDNFINKGLLKINDNHLIATYEGMMILDSIIVSLFK